MPNRDHDDMPEIGIGPNAEPDSRDTSDGTPPDGTPIRDTDRLPVIDPDDAPAEPPSKPPTPATVSQVATSPTDEQAPSVGPGARWVCSECGAVWKNDPGSWHTHETPVPGSKSRVTHNNYAITKVEG